MTDGITGIRHRIVYLSANGTIDDFSGTRVGLSLARVKEMMNNFDRVVGGQGYFNQKQLEAMKKEVFEGVE